MNPSRYQLPQHVSDDRRRAREHTLALERARFAFAPDATEEPAVEGEFAHLPPHCKRVPRDLDFPLSMISALAADTVRTDAIALAARASGVAWPLREERGYRRLFGLMRGPGATVARWRDDAEFGRQRMTGVNPMQLRACRAPPTPALWDAARAALAAQQTERRARLTLDEALGAGRLFVTDYPTMADPRVQRCVAPGATLASPTCLFWSDDLGNLMPLAIQLKRPSEPGNPAFTPLSPWADWMMARAHVQAADTHMHEAPYHLLETHMVSGAIALCLYRQVHPDHPVRQLLEPHYEYNLAINELALSNLLAKNGVIDRALSAGVPGALNAARIHYATWSFGERRLDRDLAARGVDDPGALPRYYYRDDALRVRDAIARFVASILSLWYRGDGDVAGDAELQAFAAEAASPLGGAIPGFPARVATRAALHDLVTELIFRAGPQHAAVNNGQFDAYGWIPGTPGIVHAELPEAPAADGSYFTEGDFWKAMPEMGCALAQMGMVWILSRPTKRTLLHAGDAPAFHPRLCFEADEIIGSFRRRLRTISSGIERRNDPLEQPYRYLDPLNISRSTDI